MKCINYNNRKLLRIVITFGKKYKSKYQLNVKLLNININNNQMVFANDKN